MIDSLIEGVEDKIIDMDIGDITLMFKQIDPEYCNHETYLNVLQDLKDLVIDEFNKVYVNGSFKLLALAGIYHPENRQQKEMSFSAFKISPEAYGITDEDLK